MGLVDIIREVKGGIGAEPGAALFEHVDAVRYGGKEILPMKPDDYVRASGLYNLCPREEALAARYEIVRIDKVHPMLQITFDIGHMFHRLYRDWYYGPMGLWQGAWRCIRCGWDTDAAGLSEAPVRKKSSGKLAVMPRECPSCGGRGFPDGSGEDGFITFKEWQVVNDELGISGHPDGWYAAMGYKRRMVDLKSHGANRFSARNTLRKGHDIQVWIYQEACGDELGAVWYMNKSPWGDYSNFIRPVDVPFNVKGFDMYVRRPVEELRNALNGGKVPDRTCVTKDCPRALDCQLVDICFGE